MPQATIAAPFTTYDLTVGVIVDIENIIVQLDPADVPFLGMNGADGRSALPRGTCFEKRKDWLDDILLAPRCLVGATNILIGDTTITLDAGDANRFPAGSVLLIETEYIYVVSVNATGLILTVTGGRGFGSSAAAAHATGVAIVGIGMALPEGSAPGVARSVDRANRFNITQIFGPHLISTSATENAVRKYGLNGTNEFNYQAGQRAKEVYISMEQAIAYGILVDNPGIAAKSRTMGGYVGYVLTNVDSATTTLTEQKLLDQHQACWKAGGNPKNVMTGPKQKRAISNFNADTAGGSTNILRRPAGDTQRGEVVSQYVSDFGTLDVYLNRWLRDSDLFLYDRDQLSFDTLRPLQFEMLAKTGDSLQGQLVGEYTLVVRRQKHASRFSALT
jgi:hypothetical protein